MKKLLYLLLLTSLSFGQVVVITHKAYQIHFDTKLHEPLYTHYILTKSMLNGKNSRTDFHFDSAISESFQNSGSLPGYDKGHLSPDDDFRADATTQAESMVYTNEAPQASSFNRGIWHTLENYTRKLAETQNVEVWTGCIYGKLNIPTFYWKVLKYNGKFEAYKMPNLATTKGSISQYKIDYRTFLKFN